MDTILLPGKVDGMGDFLCFSFSFCIAPDMTLVIMFKFDFIKGYFQFSLILEICVTVQLFAIPSPPFVIVICVGGQIHIWVTTDCQYVAPIALMGNGWFRITFFILITIFKIFTIDHTLTEIKVTIEVGMEVRGFSYSCERDERRRRSFTWHLRRRNKRKCYRYWRCDSYESILLEWIIPGFCAILCIPPGMWKINFLDKKYVSDNERYGELWLDIKAPKSGWKVWNICWQKVWGRHECYRKKGTPGDPGDGVPKANPVNPPHVKYCVKNGKTQSGAACYTPFCERTWNLLNHRLCEEDLKAYKKLECEKTYNCPYDRHWRMQDQFPWVPWYLGTYNQYTENCHGWHRLDHFTPKDYPAGSINYNLWHMKGDVVQTKYGPIWPNQYGIRRLASEGSAEADEEEARRLATFFGGGGFSFGEVSSLFAGGWYCEARAGATWWDDYDKCKCTISCGKAGMECVTALGWNSPVRSEAAVDTVEKGLWEIEPRVDKEWTDAKSRHQMGRSGIPIWDPWWH